MGGLGRSSESPGRWAMTRYRSKMGCKGKIYGCVGKITLQDAL